MIQLSVIVPIYNAEEYLERCVQPLRQIQGISYEVILVDDGSSDSSPMLCDCHAEKYGGFNVLHLPHGGLPEARVQGVHAARGRYITFVDSDDVVDVTYFDELIVAMEEDSSIDIAIGGARQFFADGSFRALFPGGDDCQPIVLSKEEAIREMVLWDKFGWHMWGKIYRRHLFDYYNPDRTISTGEDLASNWWLFQKATKVFFYPKKKYSYFVSPGGMIQGSSLLRKCESDLKALSHVIREAKSENTDAYYALSVRYLEVLMNERRERMFLHDGQDEGLKRNLLRMKEAIDASDTKREIPKGYNVSQMKKLALVLMMDDLVMSIFDEASCDVCGFASECDNIYVYGTGLAAQYMARILQKNNIKHRGHVISDGIPNMKKFVGFPVFHLSEIAKERNVSVILGLNEKNSREVKRLLEGYPQIRALETRIGELF